MCVVMYVCGRVCVGSRYVHVCSCRYGIYVCTCVLVYVWGLGMYMCVLVYVWGLGVYMCAHVGVGFRYVHVYARACVVSIWYMCARVCGV